MKTISDLYFECHITVEPLYDDRLEQFKGLARRRGFRVAELLMKKRAGDTAERSQNDSFCTGHGKDYVDLSGRMVALANDLRAVGIKVWRYKIEDTIIDSKFGDSLLLLGAAA